MNYTPKLKKAKVKEICESLAFKQKLEMAAKTAQKLKQKMEQDKIL